MNLLIVGCSFGTPNLYNNQAHKGFPPHTHTEFLLKNLGHNVYNCSLPGGSNLQTIEQANAFLNRQILPYNPACGDVNLSVTLPTIDLILWFHTQIHREYWFLFPLKEDLARRGPMVLRNYKVKSNDFYNIEKELASLIYSEFSTLQKITNAKLAVVGGAGPVHNNMIEYIQPDFLIENWISEIVGHDTAPIYDTDTLKRIDHMMSIDLKTKLVNGTLLALDMMKQSGYFFDGSHPGPIPHENLVNSLADRFSL
jgi:hypothetical protein